MEKGTSIWFLTSELAPLVKVGGLADMAGSLPAELRRLGLDARVALPLHPPLRAYAANRAPVARLEVPSRDGPLSAEAYFFDLDGLPVYLIDGALFRDSDAIYHADAGQDAPKYIFFSIAALLLARQLDWRPDIVQTNDWITAAANQWLALNGVDDPFFSDTHSLLTIHNLSYLGQHAAQALTLFGLDRMDLRRPERLDGFPDWARNFLLPLGMASADRLVAVSPSYAEEILTPQFGCGLEGYLRKHQAILSGILNGLDYRYWNPAQDVRLRALFDAGSLKNRAFNKRAVQEKTGLAAEPDSILAAIVARLTSQKGIDLAFDALEDWCARGQQFVLLGSGDPSLEEAARAFAARFPARAAVDFGFNAELASLIYGGADLFLMPSRFEPCGISQMIAMRYGCLPVARAVGGLKDTIRDVTQSRGTGLLFEEESHHALASALWRAEALYREPDRWELTQKRGMNTNFSWEKSVKEYISLYQELKAGQRHGSMPADQSDGIN
jgi:starch synthase